MTISFNGAPMELPAPLSLAELLKQIGIFDTTGVAVAHNQTLIRKGEWEHTTIQDGDALEVLHATAGG
jgi:thiamine biosynthesis protein ThiS